MGFVSPPLMERHQLELGPIDAGPEFLQTAELAVMALPRQQVMEQLVVEQVLKHLVRVRGCVFGEPVDD